MIAEAGRVGVIGLQGTGGAVARRLAGVGFEVAGYDPGTMSRDDLAALAASGVRSVGLPADAADCAGMVVVDVGDDAAREEALFDHGGVGETLPDGGLVVDLSHSAPAVGDDVTSRLAGLRLLRVEAAVIGTAAQVLRGGATVLLGCPEPALQQLEPVLRALTADLGGDVAQLGPVGTLAALRLLATTRASVQGAARALVGDADLLETALRLLQLEVDGVLAGACGTAGHRGDRSTAGEGRPAVHRTALGARARLLTDAQVGSAAAAS